MSHRTDTEAKKVKTAPEQCVFSVKTTHFTRLNNIVNLLLILDGFLFLCFSHIHLLKFTPKRNERKS